MMALAAIAAMTVTVSCDSDYEPSGFYSEISASKTYIPLSMDSCSTTFDVIAAGAWEIKGNPDWLSVAPATGAAGTTTVTVTADSTYDGRSAVLKIICGNKTQYVNVIQGLSNVSNASCAEVIAGPDSKTYQTKGVVTAIANTVYGNFYINDGTGEVYIYGTLFDGKTQNNPIVNNKIEVGDEVTVQGPKTTYNGTVELVDVTVINVAKSLIKCDSISASSFDSDGGEFTAFLTNKGDGLYVDVPAEAKSWLTIKAVAGDQVSFTVAPNTAGPRVATIVFKTQQGGKWYTAETSISQDGLSGTLEVPFTVSEAIAYCQKVGGDSPKEYYVKGIVSAVQSQFGAQYGNGTFWISEDGTCDLTENLKGSNNPNHDFEVYRALWFDNQKWAEGNSPISVGDEVVICGTLTLYNGLAETASGKAYVYSVNGVTNDANGLGSQAAPFNALGGIAAARAKVQGNVYVEGIVSQLVKGGFDPNYGNGSFFISVDGNYNDNKDLDFEAYQVNWLEGAKWNAETDPQIAVGDKVVLYGPLTTYNGTSETQGKGAAHVYSHTPAN